MLRVILLAGLLLAPQFAAAKVFMCVDPATGKTSFTDRACNATGTGEEVRVGPANLDSGQRYSKPAAEKTWNSQLDQRKSGLDYNAERRAVYQNRATASTK